jgi:hypothetical protein
MTLALTGVMPQILELEAIMKDLPQVDLPVEEYKIDGVYCRSMFIPAGTLLTGKIHNYENISILAQGTIKITNGSDSYEISAPHIMVDKPGIKRLGYAVTDVTFINILNYSGTQPEKDLVSDSFEEFEQKRLQGEVKCLSSLQE